MDDGAQWFGKPAHLGLGMKNGVGHGGQRLALEGQLPGTRERGRNGPRPHVGRCGCPASGQLLRSHERRSSHRPLAGKARGGHAGNGGQPEIDHHWPGRPEEDIARLEVAVHHSDGVHRAERGQRRDGDALERCAAARPDLLDDLHQRWPADVFTDNERPPFEDSRIQNLRSAVLADPLRRGDLLQEAAPDLRVSGRRQELYRCPATGGTEGQENDTLPTLAEAAEQAVSTHLARIGVAQGNHSGYIRQPPGCHQAILPWPGACMSRFRFAGGLLPLLNGQLSVTRPGRRSSAWPSLWQLTERGYRTAHPVKLLAACQAPGTAYGGVVLAADPEPGRALAAVDAKLVGARQHAQCGQHGRPSSCRSSRGLRWRNRYRGAAGAGRPAAMAATAATAWSTSSGVL